MDMFWSKIKIFQDGRMTISRSWKMELLQIGTLTSTRCIFLLSLSSILTKVGAGFWSWFDQISWLFRSDPVTGGSKRANTPCFYAPPLTHSHAVCLFWKKSAHPLRVLDIDVRRPCFLTVIIAFFWKKYILALAARTPMCAYHIFCQSSFCES